MDRLKGIEKKENRKKEEALVVSIEHPANMFGTRSKNLYGMKYRMCRDMLFGGWWTRDFFLDRENIYLFLEKDSWLN